MTNNKRIFDATPADRILDAQIDLTDAEMFAQEQRDEDSRLLFAGQSLITIIAAFAVGVMFALCWLSDNDEIFRVTKQFWGGLFR